MDSQPRSKLSEFFGQLAWRGRMVNQQATRWVLTYLAALFCCASPLARTHTHARETAILCTRTRTSLTDHRHPLPSCHT